jgi:hypothetical protein
LFFQHAFDKSFAVERGHVLYFSPVPHSAPVSQVDAVDKHHTATRAAVELGKDDAADV